MGKNTPKAIANANLAIKRIDEERRLEEQRQEEERQRITFARDHDLPVKGDTATFRLKTGDGKGDFVDFEGLVTDISNSSREGDFLVDVDIVRPLKGSLNLKSYSVFWSERVLGGQTQEA